MPAGRSSMNAMQHIGFLVVMISLLMLWSNPAHPATLVWNANREADLAGYRVYQCSQLPCRRTSAHATLLVSLGKITSLDIGTPAVIQYYVVTAYDSGNNESKESNVAAYTPPGYPPPAPAPPAPANLRLNATQ